MDSCSLRSEMCFLLVFSSKFAAHKCFIFPEIFHKEIFSCLRLMPDFYALLFHLLKNVGVLYIISSTDGSSSVPGPRPIPLDLVVCCFGRFATTSFTAARSIIVASFLVFSFDSSSSSLLSCSCSFL